MLAQRAIHMYGDWRQEDFHELPHLQYTITTIKVPFLYDWSKNQLYNDLDETNNPDVPVGHRLIYHEIDASPWGAKVAYQIYQEEGYYANYLNSIFLISVQCLFADSMILSAS